jgi:hypothetical protein
MTASETSAIPKINNHETRRQRGISPELQLCYE